jgi:5-methylcytosine-specific restriction endonuclease McrA
LIRLTLSLMCLVFAAAADGRTSNSYHSRRAERSDRTPLSRSIGAHRRSPIRSAAYCSECRRDSSGRIARRRTIRREFQRDSPCPSTGRTTGQCPGFVADHVIPLRRGAADAVENLRWQTIEEANRRIGWSRLPISWTRETRPHGIPIQVYAGSPNLLAQADGSYRCRVRAADQVK